MDALEQALHIADRQNRELDTMVSNEDSHSLIRRLMAVVLTGFLTLSVAERKLFIKFLIESVEEIEKTESKVDSLIITK